LAAESHTQPIPDGMRLIYLRRGEETHCWWWRLSNVGLNQFMYYCPLISMLIDTETYTGIYVLYVSLRIVHMNIYE